LYNVNIGYIILFLSNNFMVIALYYLQTLWLGFLAYGSY